MKNLFNSVQVQRPKSNTFDLTHDVKMTGLMGNLMPCCSIECVPGDRFNIGSDVFLRFAPLVAPIMQRIDCTVHYFFVPNRLVWENWQDFITNEPTGGLPYITIDQAGYTAEQQKFLDYMGIPPVPLGGTTKDVNAIPFAAYQMIYNEYYRDQNLITPVNFQLTDGDNTINSELTQLRRRAWEHDYFTAALPFAQKGAQVDIPLGNITLDKTAGTPHFEQTIPPYATGPVVETGAGGIEVSAQGPSYYNPDGTLVTESTTINDLRRSFRLQEWLEKMARGGSRYIEQILMHFGVKSSDARLQRPEYITGVKSPIVVSEVLNTTGETAGLPQGNMAGHAVSVGSGTQGYYNVEEHGYIIGIISVMPKATYMQGIPKNYLKTDPLEFYWPSFANIGEQEITNDEIYAYSPTGTETFGYIPRYAEYKYMPSRVAGDFRTSLNYWHLANDYGGLPTLSQQFVEVDPADCERIFAVIDGTDNLYMQVLNRIKAQRPMPVFGTPML